MTKSYKYGAKETPKSKSDSKIPESKKNNEIDKHEVEYNQFMNKKINDKIDEMYINSLERINRMQGLILEGAMKKHRKLEEDRPDLTEKERDRLWKISLGKF